MKPLLNVTRQDDELRAVENDLRAAQDKMQKCERDTEQLQGLVDKLTAEKNELTKQLATEQDASAEAEEVRPRAHKY